MKSTMSLQVDTDTLLKLIARLKIRGGSQDLSEAIISAIELWLTEQAKLPAGCDPASVRGYQWKSLFLPEGTVLRSWSYGENNYARVEGDQILHEDRAVSPNQFAQSFARTTRNAWTDLYIRRPEDKQFKLACRLRQGLAEQEKRPQAAADSVAPVIPVAVAPEKSIPIPPRDPTPGEGWTLPERRKFRFRLEDVAFD